MTTITAIKRCERCHRQVGMLPNGRALPWQPDDKGRPVCSNKGACNRARPEFGTIDPTTRRTR